MAKTRRRVLSILMALVLTLGLLPTAALAGFGGGYWGSIEVKVVDQSGSAVKDASVTLKKEGSWGSGTTRETNSTGKVVFDGLREGTYTVTATKNGKSDSATVALDDDDDEEITLTLGGGSSGGQMYNSHIDIRLAGSLQFQVGDERYDLKAYAYIDQQHPMHVTDPDGNDYTVQGGYGTSGDAEFRLNTIISDAYDTREKIPQFEIDGYILVSQGEANSEITDVDLKNQLFADMTTVIYNRTTNGVPAGTYYIVPFEDYHPTENVCPGRGWGRWGNRGYDFEIDISQALTYLTDFVTVTKHVVNESGQNIDGTVQDTFTFTLRKGGESWNSTAVAAGGSYTFENLEPGYYSIEESKVTGYVPVAYDGENWNETGYVQYVQSADKEDGTAGEVTFYNMQMATKGTLLISKDVTGALAGSHAGATYTFNVLDASGNVVMSNIQVKDGESKEIFLPAGTYTVAETAPTVGTGESLTVTMNGTNLTASNGAYAGSVTVAAAQQSAAAFVNTYSDYSPNLQFTKTVDKRDVVSGDTVTYTIRVTNAGPAPCQAMATVTDTLPAGLTLKDAAAAEGNGTFTKNGNTVTWTVPALAVGGSAKLEITATVDATASGTIRNTAQITSKDDPDVPDASVDINVTPLGDLVIEKTFIGLASSEAPTGFAATFSVKDANGTEKANVAFSAFTYDAVSGKYSYTVEDLPQATGYTVTETVTGGASIAGEVEGTKGNYVLGTENVIYPDGGTSAAVGAEPVTVQVTNPYAWTPNTQITVSYAWASGSSTWPADAAGTVDPMTSITGGTYTVGGFAENDLAEVPTISVPGYTITGWSTAQDGTAMTAEQLVAAVNAVKGGNAITLYAKLSYDKPTYLVCYALYAYVDGASEATLVSTGDYTSGVETDTAPDNEFVFTNAAASVAYDGTSYFKASTEDLTNDQLQALYARDVTADGGTWGDKNDPPKFTVKLYATTYTVGSLTITKTIDLPLSETAAWNALKDTLTFTVTATLDSSEAFTPVTVSLKDFKDDVPSYFTYTYTLKNLKPGTYTVTESGADILSAYGYTWNAEESVSSDEAVVTASGTPAVAELENVYDSREFTVIFDATLYGNVHNRNNTLIADGSSFRYGWHVPPVALDANTVSADPGWQGRLVDETFNDSQASQVSYTFTINDYKAYQNHNISPIKISQPKVTADQGYTFTGSFTTTGSVQFVDLETTVAALLESGQDQITYYANYSSSSGPIDPGPIDPGPIDPGPIDPGPSDPGTDIPDDNTPTTDLPEEETPTTELPEEETPTTELPEEEVPLAEVPATGDNAALWALAAGVSGLALVWLALSGKKRREENA